jgi:hypothetical protein
MPGFIVKPGGEAGLRAKATKPWAWCLSVAFACAEPEVAISMGLVCRHGYRRWGHIAEQDYRTYKGVTQRKIHQGSVAGFIIF